MLQNDPRLLSIDEMEIAPLSDEALEAVVGGKGCNNSSTGDQCCSCKDCSNDPAPTEPTLGLHS